MDIDLCLKCRKKEQFVLRAYQENEKIYDFCIDCLQKEQKEDFMRQWAKLNG